MVDMGADAVILLPLHCQLWKFMLTDLSHTVWAIWFLNQAMNPLRGMRVIWQD